MITGTKSAFYFIHGALSTPVQAEQEIEISILQISPRHCGHGRLSLASTPPGKQTIFLFESQTRNLV
jgi:hypothetical protein